jgi:hypothetical protein
VKKIFISLFFIYLLFCPRVFADWAFVVLGDSRQDSQRDQVLPEIIKDVNETAYRIKGQEVRPEFLLHLGDFEEVWGSRQALERFREKMKALRIKYYVARGNHELIGRRGDFIQRPSIHQVLKKNEGFIPEYLSIFSLQETYYAFDQRDLHIVVLDNSSGTFQIRSGEEIRSPQIRWLEKDLQETAKKVQAGKIRHTILCAHFPLPAPSKATAHDMAGFTSRRYAEGKALAEESGKAFWKILERYRESSRIRHLYFAHDHRYVSYRQNGFPVTITGGAGAKPLAEEIGGFYHYLLVLVTDRDLRERIVKAYPPQRNR